jgi:erythromycin esterase-like protein
MKDARSILERAYGLGVDVAAEDGSLRIGATVEPPPPELLEALRKQKGEILKLLESLPEYTMDQQRALSIWAASQPWPERLAIHRKGMAIRSGKGWPFHVAQFTAMDEARRSLYDD